MAGHPDSGNFKSRIVELARTCGLGHVGFAPAIPAPHGAAFARWLKAGAAADMDYLKKWPDVRSNPELLLEGARAVIVFLENYRHPDPGATDHPALSAVSRYARGADYHEILKNKLRALVRLLEQAWPGRGAYRVCVDTAPLMERDFAALAGLGWIGKNTCLIHPREGSFVFLGEIVTTLQIAPDAPRRNACGNCTACLAACPTGALKAPYFLDARDCIAHHTIEHRGDFDERLARQSHAHLFGCDLCQTACPWNRKAASSGEPAYAPNPEWRGVTIEQISELSETDYVRLTRKSPLKRAKRAGLQRNARNILCKGGAKK